MRAVSSLPALKSLNLFNTRVTDVGLRALINLPMLTSLDIRYCYKVTAAGVQALRTSNRGLQITGPEVYRSHYYSTGCRLLQVTSKRRCYSLLGGGCTAASTCAAAREPDAIAACMHGLHATSVCSPARNTRMLTGLTSASRDPAAPTCSHLSPRVFTPLV
jgi:hypothetical protein